MKPIKLFHPVTGPEEAEAVARVLASGWLGKGPEVEAFEREFCEYTGWRYCVTTNSCTAALAMACAWSMERGDGAFINVPAMTFVSDAHAVQAETGFRPIFMDCDSDGHAVPRELPEGVHALRTGRNWRGTSIVVHFAGRPMADLGRYGTLIIEDCAHSLGATQRPQGHAACYSFHAVKPVACGDGGALCTNDPDLADWARRMAWLGIDKSTATRTSDRGYAWDYSVTGLGYKAHWNDLLAAIGRVQLRRLDATTARRREIAEEYQILLGGVPGLALPRPCRDSSWHLYQVESDKRDALADALKAAGVHTGVHYRPLTHYPIYGGDPASTPNANARFKRTLSIPCHAGMTDSDVAHVARTIIETLGG